MQKNRNYTKIKVQNGETLTKLNIGIYSKFGQHYRYDITMYDFFHIIQFLIPIWSWISRMMLLCTIVCLFQECYYFVQRGNFFLSGSRKNWKSFPHIGKMLAKLGQNFAIFSKNQTQCQLHGVGLRAINKSLTLKSDIFIVTNI